MSRRLIVTIALAALSCSCASQFDENYIPASIATYPAKPKDFRAPIIGKYPNRPYQIIGSARFVSEHDLDFIESGLQLSARRHGADAVVLAVNSQLVRTPYTYGGGTIYRQVPGVRTSSVELDTPYGPATGRYTEVGPRYVPEQIPIVSGVKSDAQHQIAADFIVYR